MVFKPPCVITVIVNVEPIDNPNAILSLSENTAVQHKYLINTTNLNISLT